MEFDFEPTYDAVVRIKVIGVGGGGNNAVNRMISTNIRGVEFIAINTDAQALKTSCASKKLIIGEKITKGFGAGSNPEVGKRSAEESIEAIKEILANTDMVFITAGMGGGTGTGAAPVIAKAARDLGILTIGIVTKPFGFEQKKRMDQAVAGIAELSKYVDSLIVIPNDRLSHLDDSHRTLSNAFQVADDVLRRGVLSVSNLINATGFINLDFADVTTIMKNAGYAHMGMGAAKGEDKAQIAALAAISSPLLETSITGAMGVIVSITASEDIGYDEVKLASEMISAEAHKDANIIWGASFDPTLQDEIRITIIATGFDQAQKETVEEKATDDEPQPKVNPFNSTPDNATYENVQRIAQMIDEENEPEEIVEEPAPAPEEESAPAPIHSEVIAKTIPEKPKTRGYDDLFSGVKRKRNGF